MLRHPEFVAGAPTTAFIEKNGAALFRFDGHSSARASKLLMYLADMVVNGEGFGGGDEEGGWSGSYEER